MCLLLETIKIDRGKIYNLCWHETRLNNARQFLFHAKENISLHDKIHIPYEHKKSLLRCRIIYGQDIRTIEFSLQTKKEIKHLQIIHDDNIHYNYKFLDRTALHALASQCGHQEDILIVKQGLVTDTSIANVVLFDGCDFVTPDPPLLAGTKRAQLLHKGIIKKRTIDFNDLNQYKEIHLINAFRDLGDCVIPMHRIYSI